MKVAIATDDFMTVTGHVGRCNGFIVVDVQNGTVVSKEERENNFTHHRQGRHHEHGHEHNHEHGGHGHSHAGLAEGLQDCSHLICSAAGGPLVNDLKAAGITTIFTTERDAETAAVKFENGTLEILEDGVCKAH